jgi:protein-disulfide isomerase
MNKIILRVLMWAGLGLVLVGILFLILSVVNNPANQNGNLATLTPPVSDQDWVRGSKDAKLELVEYGDFQCPACGQYYTVIEQVKQDLGPNTFRQVFRHFPLSSIHRNARVASYAVEAAGKQGKFWEMHDLLFKNQSAWSEKNKPEEVFAQYVSELKLNKKEFDADVQSDAVKNKVDTDYATGTALGINSTPTFFLNGKQLPSAQSYNEFKSFFTSTASK